MDIEERFFPVFPSQPADDFLVGWRHHIASTGYPETYENVSNTKPNQVENIVLLSEEISVPTGLREGGEMIPCPFCSTTAPKFKHGRMAHFPDEAVVRFVGPKCAQTHFGDNYATAEQQFKRQQACRDYLAMWGEIAERRADLEALVSGVASTASDFQFVRDAIDTQARGFCAFLSREIAQTKGDLTIKQDLGMKDRNGAVVLQHKVIGTAAGLRFLGEDFATEPVIRRFKAMLVDVCEPLPEWSAGSPEHPGTAEILRRGLAAEKAFKKMQPMLDDLVDAKKFLERKNLALIEQWGKSPLSSPFASFEIRRDEKQLFIRSSTFAGDHFANVILPAGIADALPEKSKFAIRNEAAA